MFTVSLFWLCSVLAGRPRRRNASRAFPELWPLAMSTAAYSEFVSVLRSAGVLDEKGTWSGAGKTHLVQTGDVVVAEDPTRARRLTCS